MDELKAQPPAEQTVAAQSPNNTTDGKHPITPDRLIPSNVPPPAPQKRQSHTCKPDQTPGWKVLLEVAALLAVIAYTVAAYRQLGVMNGQLKETSRSTKAATEAAYAACVSAQIASGSLIEVRRGEDDAHKAAVAAVYQAMAATQSEASHIFFNVVPEESGSYRGFTINVRNDGKTSARNLLIKMRAIIIDRQSEPVLTYPKGLTSSIHTPVVAAGNGPEDLKTKISVFVMKEPGVRMSFTADDVKDIDEGRKDILFFARITYTDSLGVNHWRNFCNILKPFAAPQFTHDTCINYNKDDANTPLPKPVESTPLATVIPEIKCSIPDLEESESHSR